MMPSGFPAPCSERPSPASAKLRRSVPALSGIEQIFGRRWKTNHSVLTAAILIILAFNALILSKVIDGRQAAFAKAEQTTQNLALALEGHTSKVFLSVDQLLSGISEALMRDGEPDSWNEESVIGLLRQRLTYTPHIRALLILDQNGRLRFDSDGRPSKMLDLGDREYFRVHRDEQTRGLYFGGPLRGRDTGRWFIPMSHRLSSKSGEFIGAIVAIVAPEHFQAFYKALDIGVGGDVGLYLTDATLLVHTPFDDELIGRSFADAPLFRDHLPMQGIDTYRGMMPTDRSPHIVSYHVVPGLPLVIAVGLDENEVLAPWRRNLAFDLLVAVSFTATVALFTLMLVRQLVRREAYAHRVAEAERDYRGLFDNLPDGIYRSDPDGRLIRGNPALVRLGGFCDETELLNASRGGIGDWYVDPARRDEFRRLLERDGVVTNFVSEIRRHRTGERIWILENASLIHGNDGKPLFCEGTVRDITDLRTADLELRIAKERAEEASRAKSQILANMSHELRTPLNAIIGFAECLRDELFGPIGSERYRSYAGDIHASGEHLLKLINEILDLAKIEAGRFELDEAEFDIVTLIDDCRRLVRDRVERAGLMLEFERPKAPVRLRADPVRLKQVLLNLLSNAIKFTPAAGVVTIGVDRVIDGERTAGLTITVADTGIGMRAEDIPIALEPFRQIAGTLNRSHDGTGLGLPLARSLVELHGGSLEIGSAPGQGTVVVIALPEARMV